MTEYWTGKPCLFRVRFFAPSKVFILTPQGEDGAQAMQEVMAEMAEAGVNTSEMQKSDPTAFSLDSYWIRLEDA